MLVAVPPLPEQSTPEQGPVDRSAGAQSTIEYDEIPEPGIGFINALAVRVFEVLEGTRTVRQLGPTISVGVARQLATLRGIRDERRAVYRDTRFRVPQVMGARFDRPRPEIVEAAVVLSTRTRAVAVALRLEWVHQHWRACEVTVL